MVVLPLRAVGLPLVLGAVLLLAALAVLLGVARANGRLPGALLALGLLLNLLVVLANSACRSRPTLERAGIAVEQPAPDRPDAKHVLERGGTRLGLLGDRLAVRPLRTVTAYGTVIARRPVPAAPAPGPRPWPVPARRWNRPRRPRGQNGPVDDVGGVTPPGRIVDAASRWAPPAGRWRAHGS